MSRDRFFLAVRLLGVLAAVLLPALVYAQSGIRIARPLDGATVRETVNIMVPVSAVPAGGFVGFYVDGQFRCASSEQIRNDAYFVYRWDTKATNPDTSLSDDVRKPREGKHTVAVQAYDGPEGYQRKVGSPATIVVYVKNSASMDMPAKGLKLAYSYKTGSTSKYQFRNTMTIQSIQGDSTISASGDLTTGVQGTVTRNVVDLMSRSTAMIRQKLVGDLMQIAQGSAVPDRTRTYRSVYQVEDDLGHVDSVMASSAPGLGITVEFPVLPSRSVRIGDTWEARERVLRNVMTGKATAMKTVSTLEGLEWQGGYPCAKIRTVFSGEVKLPYTDVVTEPVSLNGEMLSYVAYKVGKLISAGCTVNAEATVDASALAGLKSRTTIGTSGISVPGGMPGMPGMPGGMPGMPGGMPGMPGGMPTMPGGMPGMPGMPGGMPTMPGGMPGMPGGTMPGMGSSSSQPKTMDIKVEIVEKVDLIH